ncbi:permease prefix domain 1-containing protein [Promicromonospora sp. CA-289599]|uniref:permease prefix domain 1-containing protein n=1 Tax=Promicromonospora sp. CA-289599 TaxID=3240014 RepID=UPI003D89D75C
MNTSVHRLLDEAFAGIPGTPDVQDLKEEIRANLLDRVAELTAGGVAPDEAARRAVDELGDVRALVEETSGPAAEGGTLTPPAPSPTISSAAAAAAALGAMPVARRYVAGVVVASAVALLALAPLVAIIALVVGSADRITPDGYAYLLPMIAGLVLAGPAVGWIVAASLVRETASKFGMPRRRATAYGVASALLVIGLVAGVESVLMFGRVYVALQTGVPLLVAGGAWLAYLVATQTNRHKPWVLELERQHAQVGNRFEEDPAAAARFGIYTIILWALIAAAFLAVGFTVGWQWALLPALLGVAGFMLMLARMLFGSAQGNDRSVP